MGDVMRRNINGTIDFIDRKKYLIKSGGENIYPAEIERILLAHKEVLEAIVVKLKSLRWGESPIALVSITDQKKFKIVKEELLDSINDRMFDLSIIFKKDYLHPDFKGSYSLKKVF